MAARAWLALALIATCSAEWVDKSYLVGHSRLPLPNNASLSHGVYDKTVELAAAWTTLHWRWDSADGVLHIGVRGKTGGWMGLGFTEEAGRMTPARAVVAMPGSTDVMLAKLTQHSLDGVQQYPALVNEMGLLRASFERVSGYTVLHVSVNATLYAGAVSVNIARHPTMAAFGFHGTGVMSLVVDFETGVVVREKQMTAIEMKWGRLHGGLMITAWCFLLPFAVTLKRHGKTVFRLGNSLSIRVGLGLAFKLHVMFACLVVAFTAGGFYVARVHMNAGGDGDGGGSAGGWNLGTYGDGPWAAGWDGAAIGDAGDAAADAGADGDAAAGDADADGNTATGDADAGDADGDAATGDADADGDTATGDAGGDGDANGDAGADGDADGDGVDGGGGDAFGNAHNRMLSQQTIPLNHATQGWVILVTACAMPFLGVLLPLFAPTMESGRLRTVLSFVHVGLGRALALFCVMQCFSGIIRLGQRDPELRFHMALLAVAGLASNLAFALTLELLSHWFVVEGKQRTVRDINIDGRISWKEIQDHSGADPWVVVEGRVFAVSDWVGTHPGGSQLILENAGRDATSAFYSMKHSAVAHKTLRKFYVGEVEDNRMVSAVDLAGNIAQSLVRMDLDDAERMIEQAEAGLPVLLSAAFRDLMDNLNAYLPFLPASVVDSARQGEELNKSGTAADPVRLGMEQNPPTEVAIAFTDIQASTQLWEQAPVGMKFALEEHNRVIRRVIGATRGYEVKTIGDAFMVAFYKCSDAVQFALDVQIALTKGDWHEGVMEAPLCTRTCDADGNVKWCGPRVRVGVHFGEVAPQRNPITGTVDFFGNTVNKAARVEGVAVGGTCCVTEEVLNGMESENMSNECITIPIGKVPLKGVTVLSALSLLVPLELSGRRDECLGAFLDKKKSPLSPRTRFTLSNHTRRSVLSGNNKRRQVLHQSVGSFASVIVRLGRLQRMDTAPLVLNSIVCAQIEAAARCDGIVQSISACETLVAWNTTKACPRHITQAMRFPLLLGEGQDGIGLSVGLAAGRVVTGRVGIPSQLSMVVFGGAVNLAHDLAMHARSVGCFVLASAMPHSLGVGDESTAANFRRLVDQWRCSAGDARLNVWELNTAALQSCQTAWGFDISEPADRSWSPGFSARVAAAFGGGEAGAAEARSILADAEDIRTCPICQTEGANVLCTTCQQTVCNGCAQNCVAHEQQEACTGPDASFRYLLARMDQVTRGPPVLHEFNADLDLIEEPTAHWLGQKVGERMELLTNAPSTEVKSMKSTPNPRTLHVKSPDEVFLVTSPTFS